MVLERMGFALPVNGVVSGAGGSRGQFVEAEDMVTVRMPKLELAGNAFEYVRTLVHVKEDPADLELSVYADGLLCSDLWRGCNLVLDGYHKRVAVIPLDTPS